jgi:hypothetical protein
VSDDRRKAFADDLGRRLTAFGDELQRACKEHWLVALDLEKALRDEDADPNDRRWHQAHAERATAVALWETRAGLLEAFRLDGPLVRELTLEDFEEPPP